VPVEEPSNSINRRRSKNERPVGAIRHQWCDGARAWGTSELLPYRPFNLIFLNVGINAQALLTQRGVKEDWSKTMKQIALRDFAIATSTIAFAVLFTVGWSVQSGVSLSVDNAQAQTHAGFVPHHYRAGGGSMSAGTILVPT